MILSENVAVCYSFFISDSSCFVGLDINAIMQSALNDNLLPPSVPANSLPNLNVSNAMDTSQVPAMSPRNTTWHAPVNAEQPQPQQTAQVPGLMQINPPFSVDAQTQQHLSTPTPNPFEDTSMTSSVGATLPPIASFPSLDSFDLQNNPFAFLLSQDSLLTNPSAGDAGGGDPMLSGVAQGNDDDQSHITFSATDLSQNLFNPPQ